MARSNVDLDLRVSRAASSNVIISHPSLRTAPMHRCGGVLMRCAPVSLSPHHKAPPGAFGMSRQLAQYRRHAHQWRRERPGDRFDDASTGANRTDQPIACSSATGAQQPGSSGRGPANGGQNLPPLLRHAVSRARHCAESSCNSAHRFSVCLTGFASCVPACETPRFSAETRPGQCGR